MNQDELKGKKSDRDLSTRKILVSSQVPPKDFFFYLIVPNGLSASALGFGRESHKFIHSFNVAAIHKHHDIFCFNESILAFRPNSRNVWNKAV